MKKETYSFKLRTNKDLLKEGLKVGGTIYAPNGRKGKVLEIRNVKFISETEIEVKGKAELEVDLL